MSKAASKLLREAMGPSFRDDPRTLNHKATREGQPKKTQLHGPYVVDESQISKCDDVIRALEHSDAPFDQILMAGALIDRGVALCDRDEALTCFEEVVSRYTNSPEIALQEKVLEALETKFFTYWRIREDIDGALLTLDDIAARFAASSDPQLRLKSARALNSRASLLAFVGRVDEAFAAYDTQIQRLEPETEIDFLVEYAEVLISKAALCKKHGDTNIASNLYQEILGDKFNHLLLFDQQHAITAWEALRGLFEINLESHSHPFLLTLMAQRIGMAGAAEYYGIPREYILRLSRNSDEDWFNIVLPSGQTIREVFVEGGLDYSYNNYMLRDKQRDALEHKLDRLQAEYKRRFGKDAAREAFARRASAESDSALKEGMVAAKHSNVKSQSETQSSLSDVDRAAFLEASAKHQWNELEELSPSQFMQEHFERWFVRGLTIDDIAAEQPALVTAYKEEIRHNPRKRIRALTRLHKLPPGAPRRMRKDQRHAAELSDDELAKRRAQDRAKKARYRAKHPTPE